EKREDETIDVEEFIGKKGYKAKGKRATNYEVAEIKFIEPLQKEVADTAEVIEIAEVTEAKKGFTPGSTATFTPDNDDSPTLF
ncbi:MAG: hypothetical protein RR770_09095, partial [Bacteroidales bacterium]